MEVINELLSEKSVDDLEKYYEKEMQFAEEFYSAVVDELNENNMEEMIPPEPNTWVYNGELLATHWLELKKSMIEDAEEKNKEAAEMFLKTQLAVYLNLMCAIWEIKLRIENHSNVELTVE